jgi:hypothetical protein
MVVRKALRLGFLYELIRVCGRAPQATKGMRAAAERELRETVGHRKQVLATEPGPALELLLWRWHAEAAEFLIGALWPGYFQVLRAREAAKAAGAKRKKMEPRKLVEQFKAAGYSASEASKTLQRRLPDRKQYSERTLRNAVAEQYGSRKQRS